MQRTAILNVVGLTNGMLGLSTPRICAFAKRGQITVIEPAFPALTCTAQSTYLTGTNASSHGVVGNGWYDRELCEVQFWKQSNHLVRGRKVWEELRAVAPEFTCAKLFWWYNMYSSADFSITPRPIYPADGSKVFDIYTSPSSIRSDIKRDLGDFPFPTFWGPAAGRRTSLGPPEAASRWIAASAQWIERKYQPTLSLIYLPHLDYNLQRLGPDHPAIELDLKAVDGIVGELLDFFEERSVQVTILSEYGITSVKGPVFPNRLFREQGWLAVKEELGLERLDCGASKVFAVADHQVANVYLQDPSLQSAARELLEKEPGVDCVLGSPEKVAFGIDHPRSGDLIVLAKEDAWFGYYYWLNDRLAPDFARCVDIHRKPGYDPVELFLDPKFRFPALKIAWRLLQKQLGFRMLMDVIPLDANLVRGSHGVRPSDPRDYPLLITDQSREMKSKGIQPEAVYEVIRDQVLGGSQWRKGLQSSKRVPPGIEEARISSQEERES
jgi:predicted AlkP superfamily pyrophosphatase or phosphodiesterase